MTPWLAGYAWMYRRVARAFPHDFRMICGDGLEQLGEDLTPRVWREQGVVGLARLFGDLVLHLPAAYLSSWTTRFKEFTMTGDLFEGTWRAKQDESRFDPQYKPEQACIRFEATDSGYLLVAYGIKDGMAVAERPTQIHADGRRRPIVDLGGRPIPGVPAGAMGFSNRPNAHTIEAGAEVAGKVLGKGTYIVSPDGKTLTVTTEGMGPKGPFKVDAVFERVPDPSVPQA